MRERDRREGRKRGRRDWRGSRTYVYRTSHDMKFYVLQSEWKGWDTNTIFLSFWTYQVLELDVSGLSPCFIPFVSVSNTYKYIKKRNGRRVSEMEGGIPLGQEVSLFQNLCVLWWKYSYCDHLLGSLLYVRGGERSGEGREARRI